MLIMIKVNYLFKQPAKDEVNFKTSFMCKIEFKAFFKHLKPFLNILKNQPTLF